MRPNNIDCVYVFSEIFLFLYKENTVTSSIYSPALECNMQTKMYSNDITCLLFAHVVI